MSPWSGRSEPAILLKFPCPRKQLAYVGRPEGRDRLQPACRNAYLCALLHNFFNRA